MPHTSSTESLGRHAALVSQLSDTLGYQFPVAQSRCQEWSHAILSESRSTQSLPPIAAPHTILPRGPSSPRAVLRQHGPGVAVHLKRSLLQDNGEDWPPAVVFEAERLGKRPSVPLEETPLQMVVPSGFDSRRCSVQENIMPFGEEPFRADQSRSSTFLGRSTSSSQSSSPSRRTKWTGRGVNTALFDLQGPNTLRDSGGIDAQTAEAAVAVAFVPPATA